MKFLVLPLAVCLAVSGVACGQQPSSEREQAGSLKQRLEAYVRHLFVWGPEVSVGISDPQPADLPGFQEFQVTAKVGNATQQEKFYVSADGSHMIRGVVYDLGSNPFAATQQDIEKDGYPAFGPEKAPVEVVVYSDFQCSFCKEEAKILRTELVQQYPEQVRVIFKDFPLDAIHPWARPAAIAGHCIHQQNRPAFWTYHDWVFQNQAQITPENFREKLGEWAGKTGLDAASLQSCVTNRATEAKVNAAMSEAQELGVNSTPTLFVNGRRLVGQVAWPVMKRIIDHEIRYQTERAAADCCEITIPVTGGR